MTDTYLALAHFAQSWGLIYFYAWNDDPTSSLRARASTAGA